MVKKIDPERFKKMSPDILRDKVREGKKEARKFLGENGVKVTSCPICKNERREIVVNRDLYNYYRCIGCNHIYKGTIPDEEKVVAFYEENRDYAETYINENQIKYRLNNITKPKIDYVIGKSNRESGRVLDVGCGIGTSLKYLESIGWEATGLEVSNDCVKVAKDVLGVSVKKEKLKRFARDCEEGYFDIVVMFEYLDLIKDPLSDIKTARRILSEDGLIAIHVPKYNSFAQKVQCLFPDKSFRYLSGWNIMHAYTVESTKEIFKRGGFKPESAWFYGLDFYEFINILSIDVNGFYGSDLYDYMIDNYDKFQNIIDNDQMSDYMTVVGRVED